MHTCCCTPRCAQLAVVAVTREDGLPPLLGHPIGEMAPCQAGTFSHSVGHRTPHFLPPLRFDVDRRAELCTLALSLARSVPSPIRSFFSAPLLLLPLCFSLFMFLPTDGGMRRSFQGSAAKSDTHRREKKKKKDSPIWASVGGGQHLTKPQKGHPSMCLRRWM